ncbi:MULTISPECIES: ion channel [Providencia]|uniref:NAD-binding protein n=1 Tax=Providencia rettgeri TaxID=587 RepID=A0A2U9LDF2_PRORE|nr:MULTISPECIES: ion channel [Providencia]AWS52855.1 potassium channel protein [Providencia rettgeri]EHZ7765772.1 NAD-binding protein [Providencia rettgeri]EIJ7168914.1 NAD-binding protein [Providencia rettgeri]EJD6048467.1 NAD-binding protein [Providencia rettgeri]EKT53790.1 potassium channel protein [Providencia rettgeri Dmel1]
MLDNSFVAFLKSSLSIRVLLSLLIIIDGTMILKPVLSAYTDYIDWRESGLTQWLKSLGFMKLLDIPRFLLGISLIFLSLFMVNGARIAWVFSLFLLGIISFVDLRLAQENIHQGYFSLFLLIALCVFWKLYHHHSLTSAGFVAITCIIALLLYSIFGTLYIGNEFSPVVKDGTTAFYFALVCMTTVGFGDIVPVTVDARVFTVTVIILGITIFTTSVVYIVGVLAKGTKEIVRKRFSYMKNHYVVIGSTPMAVNVYQGLKKRELPVAVICQENHRSHYPEKDNIVTGDPTSSELLAAANVKHAKCVLVMTDSDSLSTFALLGVKEQAGVEGTVKTVVLINQESNMDKVRLLKPDMLFSLSTLGSEVLMQVLCGEAISSDSISDMLLNKVAKS